MTDTVLDLQQPVFSYSPLATTDTDFEPAIATSPMLLAENEIDYEAFFESPILSEAEIDLMIARIAENMEEPSNSIPELDTINIDDLSEQMSENGTDVLVPDVRSLSTDSICRDRGLSILSDSLLSITESASLPMTARSDTPPVGREEGEIRASSISSQSQDDASAGSSVCATSSPIIDQVHSGDWPVNRVLRLRRLESDTVEGLIDWEPITVSQQDAFDEIWETGSLWEADNDLVEVSWTPTWTKLDDITAKLPMPHSLSSVRSISQRLQRKKSARSSCLRKRTREEYSKVDLKGCIAKHRRSIVKERGLLDKVLSEINRALVLQQVRDDRPDIITID